MFQIVNVRHLRGQRGGGGVPWDQIMITYLIEGVMVVPIPSYCLSLLGDG